MKHYLGICLVMITVAAIALFALHSCVASVDATVDHVRDAFAQVLQMQPKVTVNQRVVLTQTAPIAELAVVTNEEQVALEFDEHLEVLSVQIPLTEKTLTASAVYRVKAGFDLREPFSVEIDPVTHALRCRMPRAKILSVEQEGGLAYHGEDAWLNRITDDERTEILDKLQSAARSEAEQSSLKADAERKVAGRLTEIMEHNGQPMEIEWGKTPVP